ncbi:MFS transporter [Jeotgalibacillus sp. ET6]|uniref:MFS transporter n=1 Tax=Jeotgalibacillus sp. ET6 TaxID=3037260 RepID=UPI0024183798|nr:MFS transporter [Jeotgalibacillus sp. ET6]MDG5470367.1 MFS transporter [Jeotgalibacillus sp. ET6]
MNWIKNEALKVRSYHSNVKMFLLATVFLQIGLGMFMVIYNFYIRELGYDDAVNGKIISAMSLATALVLLPAGLLSDRIGRKNIMIAGTFITAGTLFFRSFAQVEDFLVWGAFATGLFTAFIQVSGIPWLAENSTKSERVHLFSIHFSIMTASQVAGSLIGGGLTDLFHLVLNWSSLSSVRWSLFAGGVFFTAAIFPLLKMIELPAEKQMVIHSAGELSIRKKAKRDNFKLIALFAVAQLLIGFGSGLVIPYLNLYFADRFLASPSYIGLIISGGQAMTAIAILIGPLVVKKIGEIKALVILQLLSLPFLLLTAFTESLVVASLGFLFRQALMNAGNPIQTSLMMEMVGDEFRGLANSINQMVFNLGWATMGPVSTGIILIYGSYWGYAWVFTLTCVLYLISSLYFLITFTMLSKRKQTSFF